VNVSAILVISDYPSSTEGSNDRALDEQGGPLGRPIVCAEVLGQSVLERTLVRLRKAGIRPITVIGGPGLSSLPSNRDVHTIVTGNSFTRWPAARRILKEQSAQGIETVFMIALGAYTEPNVPAALEFHRTRGIPLTQLEDTQGPLDFWIVNAKWFTTAATGCTLPFHYGEFPGLPIPCPMAGYVNRLAGARDLRRLVLDALLSRCELKPRGREMRPGIWLDDGARVHKSSRLVAPVYLGRSTKIGPSAVITRFSNVERNCQVGRGTVVERASILPHSVIAGGLDVSHAVVDGNRLVDLERNLTMHIDDPNLIRDTTPCLRSISAHPEHTLPSGAQNIFAFGYLSRAAGRLSEVFNWGN
jgi:hypothetical protein